MISYLFDWLESVVVFFYSHSVGMDSGISAIRKYHRIEDLSVADGFRFPTKV